MASHRPPSRRSPMPLTATRHHVVPAPSRMHRIALSLAVVLACATAPRTATAADPAPSFDPTGLAITLVPLAEGLDSPVYVTGDRSDTGALYAVEQGGRIVTISPDG